MRTKISVHHLSAGNNKLLFGCDCYIRARATIILKTGEQELCVPFHAGGKLIESIVFAYTHLLHIADDAFTVTLKAEWCTKGKGEGKKTKTKSPR